jgi:hypothetical protein
MNGSVLCSCREGREEAKEGRWAGHHSVRDERNKKPKRHLPLALLVIIVVVGLAKPPNPGVQF